MIELDDLIPASPNSFDAAFVLLKVATDPAATQARLDQLMAAGVKLKEIDAAAKRSVQAMEAREAELDAKAAEIEGKRKAFAERTLALDDKESNLAERERDLNARETRLKNIAIRLYGLPPLHQLNSMPSWEIIEEAGQRVVDPHYDERRPTSDDLETEREAVPHVAAGSTLTRTQHRRRGANG